MHPVQQKRQHHPLDFWLARGAIFITAVLNLLLINRLTFLPWWLAPSLEIALLVPLSVATAWIQVRMRQATNENHWQSIDNHRGLIRQAAFSLIALITVINFQALFAVLHALLYGAKGVDGRTLLIDALNIWLTNIVVFSLWFWNLDRGGPASREIRSGQPADFMFPQMMQSSAGDAGWIPGFIDYFFVSFTNAIAFSPTDTMPLSTRVKLLFVFESTASMLTVGLVAARAVNILA
jgi:hypothetical protein